MAGGEGYRFVHTDIGLGCAAVAEDGEGTRDTSVITPAGVDLAAAQIAFQQNGKLLVGTTVDATSTAVAGSSRRFGLMDDVAAGAATSGARTS